MENNTEHFQIYLDDRTTPPMFGIMHSGGARVSGFTTDAAEAARQAECYHRLDLDPLHLADAVEDFCRS